MPVGVASSPSPPARTCQPRASSRTAGGGTGRSPCAARTRPDPTATGLAVTRPTPRSASAAHTPTMSAIASHDPTSWNATSSGGMPCTRPSASASRAKTASAGSRTAVGRSADASSVRIRVHERCGCSSADALHVDLERAQPGPRHRARPHGDLARHDGADRGPDRVEGGTGVEQRAEQHVACDARRGVDPQVRSGVGGHARTLRRCQESAVTVPPPGPAGAERSRRWPPRRRARRWRGSSAAPQGDGGRSGTLDDHQDAVVAQPVSMVVR